MEGGKKNQMQDLNLELTLAPYLYEVGLRGSVNSRADSDRNGDRTVYDVVSSRKKIRLFRCSSKSPGDAHLDLDLRLGIGDPKEHCAGVAVCLPGDVIECILSNLDRKSLFRSKLVSKEWNRIVSARCHWPSKVTFSGIVFQESSLDWHVHDSMSFLQLDCTGGATVCPPFGIGRDWLLIDSCNGLLLFLMRDLNEVCVYDPASEVIAVVPRALTLSKRAGGSYHGLAFDGWQYQVMSIFILSDFVIILQIFSSDEATNRRSKRVTVRVPSEVAAEVGRFDFKRNVSTFFFKGNMFFLLGNWVLIYAVKDGYNKFLKLPHGRKSITCPRCMWQSEGRLYYGFGCSGGCGFQIWELVSEGNRVSSEARERIWWSLKESHQLETLVRASPEIFGGFSSNTSNNIEFGPCAFNEDFQILYLHLTGTIVSYHLNSGMFHKAFTFPCCRGSEVRRRIQSYCFGPRPFQLS